MRWDILKVDTIKILDGDWVFVWKGMGVYYLEAEPQLTRNWIERIEFATKYKIKEMEALLKTNPGLLEDLIPMRMDQIEKYEMEHNR